jgi:hypothetical protein
MRTARSWTSGENFGDFLMLAPFSIEGASSKSGAVHIGRELLSRVVSALGSLGHNKLFLGCSADPSVRSYGFYRHLGWQGTGVFDHHGDEVLELMRQ